MNVKRPKKPPRTVMAVSVEVQRVNPVALGRVPTTIRIREWVAAAVGRHARGQELTIRMVNSAEMARLNRRFRGKTGPTNVLSFQADVPPGVETALLGDIVICADVIRREAREQSKRVQAHWCHMVVHGVLHLLGYDHENERDGAVMERKETVILTRLGFPNPY